MTDHTELKTYHAVRHSMTEPTGGKLETAVASPVASRPTTPKEAGPAVGKRPTATAHRHLAPQGHLKTNDSSPAVDGEPLGMAICGQASLGGQGINMPQRAVGRSKTDQAVGKRPSQAATKIQARYRGNQARKNESTPDGISHVPTDRQTSENVCRQQSVARPATTRAAYKCFCGNLLKDDMLLCRKCGLSRPAVVQTEAACGAGGNAGECPWVQYDLAPAERHHKTVLSCKYVFTTRGLNAFSRTSGLLQDLTGPTGVTLKGDAVSQHHLSVFDRRSYDVDQLIADGYITKAKDYDEHSRAGTKLPRIGLSSLGATMAKLKHDEDSFNRKYNKAKKSARFLGAMLARLHAPGGARDHQEHGDADGDGGGSSSGDDGGGHREGAELLGKLRHTLWPVLLLLARKKTSEVPHDPVEQLNIVFNSFASKTTRAGSGIMTFADLQNFGRIMKKMGVKFQKNMDKSKLQFIFDEEIQLEVDMASVYNMKKSEAASGLCFERFQVVMHKAWRYNISEADFDKLVSSSYSRGGVHANRGA